MTQRPKVKTAHKLAKTEKSRDCSEAEPKDVLLWDRLLSLDELYTEKLSVCAKPDSSWGHLRPIMKILEVSCHGIPWYIGTIAWMLVAYKPATIEFLMNLFIGLFLDITIVGLAKVIIRRARPAHNHMDMFATMSVDNYSFPSGHATRASMLLWLFVEKLFLPGSVWSYLMGIWSVSVCLSRVILGRHHILDIVIGFLIGIAQYYVLLQLWLPAPVCISILEPFLGHFHL